MRTQLIGVVLAGCLSVSVAATAEAQYFGQNKVQHRKLVFSVLETEHFHIYYYQAEAEAARQVGRLAERWYSRLSTILGYQLPDRQILVLYASHPEFGQTNVIEGEISEGVGGVTESGRRRIVLPMAASLADTEHVVGHELVHAFQYDILGRNAGAVPLWMIEGMAEYLSIGPRSSQTAMWLRDAAYENRLPTVKNLDDPRYFPYRFGHAFWAYLTGRFGDQIIVRVLEEMLLPTAATNPISALEKATLVDNKTLSDDWHNAIRLTYDIAEGGARPAGGISRGVVIDPRTERGRLDVSPALSPDGQRIAYLSQRGRLSIDLYLADATTGKVIRRLVSTAADPHFDSLQFLASAGTWAPDGSRLAVATVREGGAVLAIFDGESGNRLEEIPFADIGEILHPAWSPDGRSVAFAGQAGGFTDIYLYAFESRQLRQLTQDAYGDLQPAWSPDGNQLVFVTERNSTDLSTLAIGGFSLATLSVGDGRVAPVDTKLPGNTTSPQWSPDGRLLYFISDADGRPNVYRADAATGRAERVTSAATGVSGITLGSAALSVAAKRDRMAVTVFRDSGYEIHVIDAPSALVTQAEAGDDFAQLPPSSRTSDIVSAQRSAPQAGLPPPESFVTKDHKPGLKLVSIGQQGGVSTSQFGTFFGGGISFGFSDVLGEHLLGASVGINGGIRDIGGSLQYVNRTSRWNWGVFGERAPLVSGAAAEGFGVVNGQTVFIQQTELFRQTITQAGALTAYPFSRATRLEFSGDVQRIGFDQEIRTLMFDPVSGVLLSDESVRLPVAAPLRLVDATAALVHDASVFGATGPILGRRLRLEIAQTAGDLRFTTVTADVRRYVMPVQPITLAGRLLHVGRYGASGEDQRLMPLFLGYPSLVRGYEARTFSASECTITTDGSCPEFDRLIGSRILVANGEVRAPAVGLFTGKLQYGALPIDLVGFADAGIAWTSSTSPVFAGGNRRWATSVGVGARFNLFGIIGEIDLVHPLGRPERRWVWVFSLRSGF